MRKNCPLDCGLVDLVHVVDHVAVAAGQIDAAPVVCDCSPSASASRALSAVDCEVVQADWTACGLEELPSSS